MRHIFTILFLYFATILEMSAQYVQGTIIGSDTIYRPITPSLKDVQTLELQSAADTARQINKGQSFIRQEYIPCDCPNGHSIENGPCNPLDNVAMTKVYRADFSYLVAGLNDAALVNQLVVQVDKPSLSLTYIYLDKTKRRVISPGFNVKIGTVDDLPTLFANGKWNTVLNLGARFNIDLFKALTPQYERYYYLPEERDRVLCRVQKAELSLSQRKEKLANRSNLLTGWINAPSSIPDFLLKDTPRGDYRVKLIIEKDSIDLLLRADSLNKYRRTVLDNIQLAMKWSGKEHLWVSFNPDLSPRTINIFDASDQKSQQVPERTFLTATLPMTLNYYRSLGAKKMPSLYTALVAFERTNDLLNKDYRQEFEKEVSNYTATLGEKTYANVEKKKFYVGNNRMIWNTKLGVQTILFFNKEQHFGIIASINHIIPNSESVMNRSYTNISIGAIVPAVTTDGKSKLNVIVTGVLTDSFGNVEKWKSQRNENYEHMNLWGRLALTVKVGLPINFLSN